MLAEDRAAGLSFDAVFEENARCAARGSASWERVLTDTRESWRRSWDMEETSTHLSPDLLEDAGRVTGAAVLLG